MSAVVSLLEFMLAYLTAVYLSIYERQKFTSPLVKNGIFRMFAHSPKLVVLVYVSSFIPNIDKVVKIVQILFFSYILLVAVVCTYFYKLLHKYHSTM